MRPYSLWYIEKSFLFTYLKCSWASPVWYYCHRVIQREVSLESHILCLMWISKSTFFKVQQGVTQICLNYWNVSWSCLCSILGKERKGTKSSEHAIQGHVESFLPYTPFIFRVIHLQCHRKTVWFTRRSSGMELDRHSLHGSSTY